MKIIKNIFIAAVLFITNSIISQPMNDLTKTPELRTERIPKHDIKHIKIDLGFDWSKKQAYGYASIIIIISEPADKVTLDAGMLSISSISAEPGIELSYKYDGGDSDDNLIINLDRLYKSGEEIVLNISYRTNYVNEIDPNNLWGSYGKGLRFYYPTANDPLRPKEIWASAEPYSNRYWYPCFDSPNDLRTTEFIVTVDKDLTAVSNGILAEIKDNPDGTRTFRWKTTIPYANHLTSFAVSEYVNVKQKYNDVEINNFGYPKEKEWIEATVERLPDMMRFFSELTGVEYPFPVYSQAFVQDLPAGMDNFMFSAITENMVDDKPTHADFLYLWDALEAQMLASQWFGAYVTPAGYEHAWLNESFARYYDELYAEHKNGYEEFQLWYRNFDLNTYLWDWNNNVRRPVVTANYDNAETMIRDNYSFVRGALVLHMLRKHLGEEKWSNAVNIYLRSNGNKLVKTSDFQKAVEESAGEPMDWFFRQWVYQMGHPVFEVSYKYNSSVKKLLLTVKQTQKPDSSSQYPQAEFFEGKMDIKIDKEIYSIFIEAAAEKVYSFDIREKPELVSFDHAGTWIKEITFNKPLDELLYQFLNDDEPLSRNWALGKLAGIAKDENTKIDDKQKIYKAFRKIILSSSYWRVRLNVLSQYQSLVAPFWETNPVDLDEDTRSMLLTLINNDSSWLRSAAIAFLGMTREEKYTSLFVKYLNDKSFRVINSSAIALGKTNSPQAYSELMQLLGKPSMKSQSLLCLLGGLRELGDERGLKTALDVLNDSELPRWRLPSPPIWDYRIIAAQNIAALGKSELAYPIIFQRLNTAVKDSDLSGIFNNLLIIIELKDPKGQEAFDLLKNVFKDNKSVYEAVLQHETMFKESIVN